VIELWRVLRDPRVSTTLALAAVAIAGLLLLSQGWRGTAATLLVAYQVPYLVSGAVAGFACTGAGLALLRVHLDRMEAAQERLDSAALQREVLRMLTTVVRGRNP
jgi:hypothetical protein